MHFFDPFFTLVLFNHLNLSLVECSFLISVLLFGTIGKLVEQNPDTSIVSWGYLFSIALFLTAAYVSFHELIWWKAIINTVVSLIVFMVISEFFLQAIIVLFSGFYNYKSGQVVSIKRRGVLFVGLLFLLNITLMVLNEKII